MAGSLRAALLILTCPSSRGMSVSWLYIVDTFVGDPSDGLDCSWRVVCA